MFPGDTESRRRAAEHGPAGSLRGAGEGEEAATFVYGDEE